MELIRRRERARMSVDETKRKFNFGDCMTRRGAQYNLRKSSAANVSIKVYIENHPQSRDIINKFFALLFLPPSSPLLPLRCTISIEKEAKREKGN